MHSPIAHRLAQKPSPTREALSCRDPRTPASAALSSLAHQRLHPGDYRRKPVDDGLPDQEVADIELHDLRQSRDRADIAEGQPMPGMTLEPERGGKGRGLP